MILPKDQRHHNLLWRFTDLYHGGLETCIIETKKNTLVFTGPDSCTAHQMEIFVQEFEPASYFCDWTCVHLGMRRQK